MAIFVVRHGETELNAARIIQMPTTPLSERGREEARVRSQQLAGHDTPPALVLTSPLLRGRQTAEQIAQATGAELVVDERLAPGATAETLLKTLEGREGPVAVVGHQPDCSEIAFELTGEDPGFPTGGVAEIELED